MMEILKACDVSNNLITVIKPMYSNTRAKVIKRDGETEYFKGNFADDIALL